MTTILTGVAAAVATVVALWLLVMQYLRSEGERTDLCALARTICGSR